MFIVGMSHISCSVWEDVKSDQCVFVLNRSALFCTVCNLNMDDFDWVCSGIVG